MALMKGGVQTANQVRAELEGDLATWGGRGFGVWALLHKDGGAFVDECGLWLGTAISAFARITLAKPWCGQGLAGEAVV